MLHCKFVFILKEILDSNYFESGINNISRKEFEFQILYEFVIRVQFQREDNDNTSIRNVFCALDHNSSRIFYNHLLLEEGLVRFLCNF